MFMTCKTPDFHGLGLGDNGKGVMEKKHGNCYIIIGTICRGDIGIIEKGNYYAILYLNLLIFLKF